MKLSCFICYVSFLYFACIKLQDVAYEAFKPLTKEEEAKVAHGLSNSNRYELIPTFIATDQRIYVMFVINVLLVG